MKVVLDTMIRVSYCTRRNVSRHRLIDRDLKAKVRLFVSDYILDELAEVLREELNENARYYVHLARRAVLRRAKRVVLPRNIRLFVAGDPKDNAIVQTALSSKSDYLVTADKVLLDLGKVQDVEIITVKTWAQWLPTFPRSNP
jgi:putative PIN family toxin of toxin-antitoxin system